MKIITAQDANKLRLHQWLFSQFIVQFRWKKQIPELFSVRRSMKVIDNKVILSRRVSSSSLQVYETFDSVNVSDAAGNVQNKQWHSRKLWQVVALALWAWPHVQVRANQSPLWDVDVSVHGPVEGFLGNSNTPSAAQRGWCYCLSACSSLYL